MPEHEEELIAALASLDRTLRDGLALVASLRAPTRRHPSRPGMRDWWAQVLVRGWVEEGREWDAPVTKEVVYAELQPVLLLTGTALALTVSHALQLLLPPPGVLDSYRGHDVRVQRIRAFWRLPPLAACRAHFASLQQP